MKAIYLGDSQTKEFHSIKRQKPECNVKGILASNRVQFDRGKDAKAAGFDACAHCVRHWKSKH
jgi:hypothetical protein